MKTLLRHIHQSLALKLSVGILLLSIPIFVIALGMLFIQSRHIIKEEATERAVSVLNSTAQHLGRYLNIVETATTITGSFVKKHFEPDSLLSYTQRIVQFNGDMDGCSISAEPDMFPQYGHHFSAYTIREGDSILSTIEEPYDYFNNVWYKLPHTLGEACWVDYYDVADTLQMTLDGLIASYSIPLYDTDGQFKGVISSDLALRHLSKVISSEKPYPHSYFIMTGKEGNYFIHPDSTRLFTETIFSGRNPNEHTDIFALGHEMISGKTGYMRVNIDGESCLVCYQPVPGTQWSLALICPDSDILQAYQRLGLIVVPLLVVGLLLILLYCHRAVAHTISPLNQLVSQSQLIAEGQYDNVHIPHSQRQDVVGRLQNSFATMQVFLNFHEGSIRYVVEQNKQRNKELALANKQVIEASRQKITFIQNMTHQIRTPLNIIMGFAQIAGEDMEQLPEEERKSISEMMSHNAKILYRIVMMLFDSSDTGNTLAMEINRHQDDLVACNEMVREVISYTNEHFPSLPVHFQSDVTDDYCIHSNRLYLMRSLRELLYNAAKHSDGQHITIRVLTTDTTVRFIIEDTGSGISEEHRDMVFVPFNKVNDLSEGLGLGLPLAKRHINALGGSLTLDDNYHDGCRFIIDIPIN